MLLSTESTLFGFSPSNTIHDRSGPVMIHLLGYGSVGVYNKYVYIDILCFALHQMRVHEFCRFL